MNAIRFWYRSRTIPTTECCGLDGRHGSDMGGGAGHGVGYLQLLLEGVVLAGGVEVEEKLMMRAEEGRERASEMGGEMEFMEVDKGY